MTSHNSNSFLTTPIWRWPRATALLLLSLAVFPVVLYAQIESEPPQVEEVFIEESGDTETNYDYDQDAPIQTVNYADRTQYATPPTVNRKPIAEENWNAALENLDYSADRPAPPREPRRSSADTSSYNQNRSSGTPRNSSSGSPAMPDIDTAFWSPIMKGFAILLLLGLIAFVIYRLMQEPKNTAIARDGTRITIHNLEDYIHETDLDRFLKAALAEQNYAQAVRVYFLQVIKDLSAKKAIIWSREKTNRTYLREMRMHPATNQFNAVTNTYERVWYGNAAIGAKEYAAIEPQMRQMLQLI
jgi:hypothetical protein